MSPTGDAPVVRLSRDGQRHLDALRWGLVTYFTNDIKKARKRSTQGTTTSGGGADAAV